jgi:AcrR family transcriptional regulator
MARRSDHTREALTEIAVAAGQKILSNEGMAGLSARKVAKEIGYTVGTIYNVFGSHHALMLHINAVTLDDLYAAMAEQTQKGQPSKQVIKKLAKAYITFATEHDHRWTALFEHTLPRDAELPDWYADKIQRLFQLVEVPLLSLFKGDKRKTERAARVVWASIHGICHLGMRGKLDTVKAESIQVLTNNLIDTYLQGIQGHE